MNLPLSKPTDRKAHNKSGHNRPLRGLDLQTVARFSGLCRKRYASKFVALIVIFTAISKVWAGNTGSEIIYADYLGGGGDLTFDYESYDSGPSLLTGHVGEPLRSCGLDDIYVSVCTRRLIFGVPLNLSESNTKWKFADTEFIVQRVVRNSQLFGVSERVFVIESSAEDGVTIFLYSKNRGLLGFKEKMYNHEPLWESLFLLQGTIGFGALDNQNSLEHQVAEDA
jgi:hypothetical protein